MDALTNIAISFALLWFLRDFPAFFLLLFKQENEDDARIKGKRDAFDERTIKFFINFFPRFITCLFVETCGS